MELCVGEFAGVAIDEVAAEDAVDSGLPVC